MISQAYLLIILIAVLISSGVFGEITVYHKLTKKIVQRFKNEFHPFKSSQAALNSKGPLLISNLIDACTSIILPPKTELESLKKDAILKPSWILLTDDTSCDAHYKIVQAQRQGYAAIIIYSTQSSAPKPMRIESDLIHLYEIKVSFIGLEDGLELKKYAYPKPYVLTLERDWSFSVAAENIYYYLIAAYKEFNLRLEFFQKSAEKWTAPYRNAATTVVQILILSSPILVLVAYSRRESQRKTIFEEPEREHLFRERRRHRHRERHRNRQRRQEFNEEDLSEEQNDQQVSTPEPSELEKYRQLLGVSETATKAEVESAFRRKSASFHPDKNRHLLIEGKEKELEEKTEMFKKMNEAKIKLLELC